LSFIGVQAAVLLGFWFLAWVATMVAYRPWHDTDPGTRYLWCMSAPMFVIFLLFSLRTHCEPNWPVTAYLSGLVLTAQWLAGIATSASYATRAFLRTCVACACLTGLGAIFLMHYSETVHPLLAKFVGEPNAQHSMPLRKIDPTCRLRGWRLLALEVDKLRAKLRREGSEPILAAASWTLPGEIGFYCEGHPTVYCLGPVQGERHSEYDLWHPNPIVEGTEFLKDTFIFIGEMTEPLKTAFDEIEPARTVTHYVNGRPVASWSISVCHSYRGVWHLQHIMGFATF
jgi:hypothetical protein